MKHNKMSPLRLYVAQKSMSIKGTCGFLLGGYSGEFGETVISEGGWGFAGITAQVDAGNPIEP